MSKSGELHKQPERYAPFFEFFPFVHFTNTRKNVILG
jgi:hypothetical protein